MEQMIPPLSVGDAKNVDSTFVDYQRFQGEADIRAAQRGDFVRGEAWAPDYDYPALDTLYDESDKTLLLDRKAAILRAIHRLEIARVQGELDENEAELYASFHEARLMRIMLVEAARDMRNGDMRQEVARQRFMELNEAAYGEFNQQSYFGMLVTERDRVEAFEPADASAQAIKDDLLTFFAGKELTEAEPQLLEPEFLAQMQEYVLERYRDVLAAVPDEDENIVYDAQQCRDIMERALEVAGLKEKGWKVVIDSKKSNPATAANKKKISLPAEMSRTPSALRRLILHEMEVHGRRGQNGSESNLKILEKGTADYADVEEGLGVFLECVLAGDTDNPSFHRARDRYITAGLALGAGDVPRDARQTFEILWRLLAVRSADNGTIDAEAQQLVMDQAYVHVENAFRGTNFAMPGVIYTKLKIYYEGLQKNAQYFKDRTNSLDEAFDVAMAGKFNHTDPVETQQVLAFAT